MSRKARHETSSEFFEWAESYLEKDVSYSANILFEGENPTSKQPETPVNSSGNSFCFLNLSCDLHENQMKTFKNGFALMQSLKAGRCRMFRIMDTHN
ncbi:hypothetical protein [Rhodohalobacter sp.]|uniref:hypothetical protein n=1 Tax=Rhodohalobacter sp. TaxID=1974210 RepID=UPI002ACDD5E8|nr:hypothetical protein [Rhodohalobacter sp.]MDZ7757226.1 hypothetical protein [Rhodohalobacter sp.]